MRKMIMLGKAALIAVILMAAATLLASLRPQMLLYPLVRQAARAKIGYETRELLSYETAHFTVRYTPGEQESAKLVAAAAESAYLPVNAAIGYTPREKTLIVVYPDRRELSKAFGWAANQSAMGVYWGGVIQVLSPGAWLKGPPEEFVRAGPMVHEYTHLVFDHVARGNYPRWFTEGLAQYLEYKVNGYEWRTAGNSLSGRLYTVAELAENFDGLPNQALAYRQSLAAVRYIAAVHGEDKLRAVIDALAAGRGIEDAITISLGTDYAAFSAAWPEWARDNMN